MGEDAGAGMLVAVSEIVLGTQAGGEGVEPTKARHL